MYNDLSATPSVHSYRHKGYQIADQGNADRCDRYVNRGEYHRIGLYDVAAWHFYKAEMLLKKGESYSDDQTGCQSDERYHPAFKHEDTPDEAVFRAEASQGLHVILLLDYEH